MFRSRLCLDQISLLSVSLLSVAASTEAICQPQGAARAQYERSHEISESRTPGAPWVSVGAVLISPQGEIQAAFPQENTVRVFSRTGELLRSFGRKGSGPAETSGMGAMGWIEGSTWVFDRGNSRFMVYGAKGEYQRTVSAPSRTAQGVGMVASALLPGGRVLYRGQRGRMNRRPDDDGTIPVALGTPQSASLNTIARPDGNEMSVMQYRDGVPSGVLSGGESSARLSESGLVRVSPDGSRIIWVSRPAAKRAGRSEVQIIVFNPIGERLATKNLSFPATPVSASFRDSVVTMYADALHKLGSGGPNGKFSSVADAKSHVSRVLPIPAFYPPVSEAVVANDGSLWLRGADTGRPQLDWHVYDASLKPVHTVSLPSELAVRAVTDELVVGVTKDSDDLPRIDVFRRVNGR